MYTPDYLRIVNLSSHTDTTFKFVHGRTVMIKGRNEYDKNPKSNGSGKSVLVEGVSIAFTGEIIKKISVPDIIKDGCQSAGVEFQMTNKITGKVIQIFRTIYRAKGSSSKLKILENGVPVKFAKVPDGTDWILNEIGISKSDLYNFYIISKRKYTSFFYSTDGEKRKLISRFSNANIIDGVYSEVEFDVKAVTDSIARLSANRDSLSGKIEAYNEQLSDLDNPETKKKLIDGINEAINEKLEETASHQETILGYSNKILDYNKELKDNNNAVKVAEGQLLKLKPKDFSNDKKVLRDKILDLENIIESKYMSVKETDDMVDEIQADIRGMEKSISDIDKQLLNKISCPECKHEFIYKSESLSVKDLNKNRKSLQSEIDEAKESLESAVELMVSLKESVKELEYSVDKLKADMKVLSTDELKSVEAINSKKKEISNLKSDGDKVSASIEKAKTNIDVYKQKISSVEISIVSMKEEIEEINNRKSDATAKAEINKKIKTSIDEMLKIDQDTLELEADKSAKLKWVEMYKRFNIKLSNMAIKSIEGLTNDIQKRIGSNLSLSMDGYKVNRDGSVSDQITANVMRYGVFEGTFFRFSEGEQGGMNISATLAMQQLINMNCKSGGLDMLFVDEITESLDAPSVATVIKALDSTGRTVAIITHASDEQVVVPNEITIVKTSEGSKIEDEI